MTPSRVGFIGLGIMGSRMAASLRRAGFELVVFNRTRERAEAFAAEHDATVAGSPGELAGGCEAIITMVGDGPDVEEVLLGEAGAANGAAEGTLLVDMSTISPDVTRRIGAAVAERGLRFMDAPVSGSSPKAQDGTLTIMAGGDAADFDQARPLFEAMGERIFHVGPLGHGQAVKLVNNSLAAANAAAVAEALIVADAAGLDLEVSVEVVGAGSGASAMLALKSGAMREHDFTPLFKLSHMLKDVNHCLDQASAAGVPFPAAAHAAELLGAAAARGHEDDDFAALVEAAEASAGRSL